MTPSPIRVPLLLALALIASCMSGRAEEPAPVVRLVDPGSEPRSELRYRIRPGQRETMVVEVKESRVCEIQKRFLPGITLGTSRMEFVVEARSVSPEGVLRYDFEGETEPRVKLKGSGAVTVDGRTQELDLKLRKDVSPQESQTMASLRQTLVNASVGFPREPVGKGAKWAVDLSLEANGMKYVQTMRYVLTEFDGQKGRLAMTAEQDARPVQGPVDATDTPSAAPKRPVIRTGTGSISFDLERLVAESHMEMDARPVPSSDTEEIVHYRVEKRVSRGNQSAAKPVEAKKE
jgi:hypothetical protein